MKLQFLCTSCQASYLVDVEDVPEHGGSMPCAGCGNVIALERAAGRPHGEPHAETPETTPEDSEIVCPRCGLHFVPRRGRGLPSPGEAELRPVALVVDDMDYFLDVAREALRARFEVRTARGVKEALSALAAGSLDLIVLDPTLGGGRHGIALLRKLRPKPCPILVFAAEDESDLYGAKWEQMRALGCDDIVLKGMHAGETLARKAAALLDLPVGEDTLD